MRLSCVFFLISMLHVTASVYSQDAVVSIDAENISLEQLFTEIERQADVKFLFRHEAVDGIRAGISVKDVSIDQVLKTVLPANGLKHSLVGNNLIVIASSVQLDGIVVSGTVTDEAGEPMPGVNVVVKGTTTGVITGGNGKYNITVPNKDAVLVFSFMGYTTQELTVGDQTDINVILNEDLREIEEVVVIGYGVQRKMDLTGSIGNVDQKVISTLPVSSIDQRMVGQVSGVQIMQQSGTPGGGTSVKIRGNGSIGAGNQPLYVVDGMPYSAASDQNSNPLIFINPNDIESVTVLKDASSTAIYGSRGANGVIMITTQKGDFNRTSVNFSAMAGIQQVPQKGRPDMMNQREFAEFQQEKIGIVVGQRENREATLNDYPEAYRYPEQMVGDGTDWYDLVLQNALIQDYNLNVQKGSKDLRTNLSLGYYNQNGVLQYTNVERYTARLSVDSRVGNAVMIGATLQPAYTEQRQGIMGRNRTDVLGIAIWGNPVAKPYDENGELIPYILSPGNSYNQPWSFANPLFILREQSTKNYKFQNIGSAYFEWKIIPDLTFKTTFNTIWNSFKYTQYVPGTVGNANAAPSGYGKSDNNRTNNFNWLTENTLNYNKKMGKHGFDILLGFTAQKDKTTGINLTAYPYTSDLIHTINTAQAISAWGEGFDEWSMISYLGRINYNYSDRYLLTATFRSDGSSRFGSENRYAFFPSVAGAWRISEENFLKNNPLISNLKLRLSWGKSGNNNIGNYAHVSLINSGSYVFAGNQVTASSIGQSNPYLGWEESSQVDAGIDLGLFKNRLSLVVDYYHRKSVNMLLDNMIPAITGFNSQKINEGNIRNTGVEISLQAIPISGDFTWNININMAFNRNKVIALNENIERITSGNLDDQPTHVTIVGKPIGQFFGFIFDGLYTAEDMANPDLEKTLQVYEGNPKYRDMDGDGVINNLLDFTIIGNPHPDFIYGLTNTFHYKGFDLNVIVNGQYGGHVINALRQTVDNQMGFFNVSREWLNRWKSTEDPGDGKHYGIPKVAPAWGHKFSTRWIEDASYLRISNVTLGYNFPQKWMTQTGFIQNCRIYCTVQNLATFTNYGGANPEAQATNIGDTLAPGFDMTSYPLARTLSFGLNLSF